MQKEKNCPVCETRYYDPSLSFHKNAGRADGLDWRCKNCKRAYSRTQSAKRSRQLINQRRYEKDLQKVIARDAARKFHKIEMHKCSAFGYHKPAEEMHHVDYNQPLMVVFLCSGCHRGIHAQ